MSVNDGHPRKPDAQQPEIRLQINALSNNGFFLQFSVFSTDFPSVFPRVVLGCITSGSEKRAPFGCARLNPLRMKAQPMSHPTEPREAVRRNAQSHFTHTERRDELVRQEIEKERAATDAKTARLRALRLAKEANERAEAETLAAERAKAGIAAPKPTRRRKVASRT